MKTDEVVCYMRINISSNIQEQVYKALKNDILYGVLEPGTQLKELELSEIYGVSRSPIREALRRLCGDGLVELTPNCGISVRVFTEEYVEDILDMRILLEGCGMERMCTVGMTAEEKEELLFLRDQVINAIRDCDSIELPEHMNIDTRLHCLFNSFNHNQVMTETWQRIVPVNVVVQRISLNRDARALQSQEEHLKIIESLLNKDFEAANEMNKLHLKHTQEHVERALKEKKK